MLSLCAEDLKGFLMARGGTDCKQAGSSMRAAVSASRPAIGAASVMAHGTRRENCIPADVHTEGKARFVQLRRRSHITHESWDQTQVFTCED